MIVTRRSIRIEPQNGTALTVRSVQIDNDPTGSVELEFEGGQTFEMSRLTAAHLADALRDVE